jgi:hypothetical protein
MRKPCVFVSSTCYDLKQERADLRTFLEGLGLEPLLSEFDSFPVDPSIPTVDNCLKVVEAKADLFVLIVGGRYGTLSDSGKSITNLEFLGAQAKGIPIFVFVSRTILNILPIYKSNPTGDFAAVVESPKLLEFVSEITKSGKNWVFPFDVAQNIFETLRSQFGYLFAESLELRSKVSQSGLTPKLRELRGSLLRLLIERPKGWEYLLLAGSLNGAISDLADLRRDWTYGLISGPTVGNSFREVFLSKVPEIIRVALNVEKLVNEVIPIAVGAPGQSGDPDQILYVVNRLAQAYKAALEWKLDLRRVDIAPGLRNLRAHAETFCDNMVTQFEDFSRTLNESLPKAVEAARSGEKVEVRIVLKVTMPDPTAFYAELKSIQPMLSSGEFRF